MKNLTISLDDSTYKRVREKAQQAGMSLNAWARRSLSIAAGNTPEVTVEAFLKNAAEASASAQPWKWNRDDLYENE
jgi:negative regulator of replication initiation